jgi:RNase H-like domain found in reverse transcriptase/Integrase zinc binding domain
LGLVRYVAIFLPKLADFTAVLTPLTTKEARKEFPEWTSHHQIAFKAIKSLVVSCECLTTIDHQAPGDCNIYVTCDASDWRTGATLSFSPSWETAHPVAFDSMQLKGAEKNYPVHKKELLAIIRTLKKWRSDLLGSPIFVYTDHRTLENFDTQRDLCRRQLRWQELMSQYDMQIMYIRGEDNTVADALSRVAPNGFPEEQTDLEPHTLWSSSCAVLRIEADKQILRDIKLGYEQDNFCIRLPNSGMKGITNSNGLWYISSRLVIPHYGNIRENLFQLAHDSLGHFGADKSYGSLRDAYYWPNMRWDLEKSYIPSCIDCQRNKSRTTKPVGPLHPLPVPDVCGDSVAMDFIGPLPPDSGFDMILSITDRLGSDIRIIPTNSTISANELAVLFFDNWYCKNGLPQDIVSDCDKLFVSRFWKALEKLTGVSLKMSTAYHPETDGSSERSNKTINQSIRYHVQRNQKGWVRALPHICFCIMNTINASTNYSPFQLRMGRSPHIIPPIVPSDLPPPLVNTDDATLAANVIEQHNTDVDDVKDALLYVKVSQAHFANSSRGHEDIYIVGDLVMLTMLHRRNKYKKKGEKRVTKFLPRFDGPYKVTKAYPETSSYTLDMLNSPNVFLSYHASELK